MCTKRYTVREEVGNEFDPFAVSIVRDSDIIGHVPKKSRQLVLCAHRSPFPTCVMKLVKAKFYSGCH